MLLLPPATPPPCLPATPATPPPRLPASSPLKFSYLSHTKYTGDGTEGSKLNHQFNRISKLMLWFDKTTTSLNTQSQAKNNRILYLAFDKSVGLEAIKFAETAFQM
jgi:hypothetical protein